MVLRETGEQGRNQWALHDQTRITFLADRVVAIVMNTMAVERQRAIAEQ